jgi:hypothetical protein
MTQQTRQRLSYLVLFLLLIWVAIQVKTQILPLLSHPFVSHQQSSASLWINYGPLFVLGLALLALLSPGKQTTTVHGSAHFATNGELKTYGTLATTLRREQKTVNNALTVGTPPPRKCILASIRKSS